MLQSTEFEFEGTRSKKKGGKHDVNACVALFLNQLMLI